MLSCSSVPGTAAGSAGAGEPAIPILVVPRPTVADTINSNVNAHKTSAAYFFMDPSSPFHYPRIRTATRIKMLSRSRLCRPLEKANRSCTGNFPRGLLLITNNCDNHCTHLHRPWLYMCKQRSWLLHYRRTLHCFHGLWRRTWHAFVRPRSRGTELAKST